MNWEPIENALRSWVRVASGFDDSAVIWDNQNGSRPARPFITLHLEGPLALGAVDAVTHKYSATRPAGAEIEIKAEGPRELTLSIQCYGLSPIGSDSPRAVLSRVQTKLGLPSVKDALGAAGVSVFDKGRIQDLSEILDTGFEARALLEVRCYAVESATETSTYIKTVELTDEGPEPDKVFTVTGP